MTATTIENHNELFRCEAVAARLFRSASDGPGDSVMLPCHPTGPVAGKGKGGHSRHPQARSIDKFVTAWVEVRGAKLTGRFEPVTSRCQFRRVGGGAEGAARSRVLTYRPPVRPIRAGQKVWEFELSLARSFGLTTRCPAKMSMNSETGIEPGIHRRRAVADLAVGSSLYPHIRRRRLEPMSLGEASRCHLWR
jgi:hypothetical protein